LEQFEDIFVQFGSWKHPFDYYQQNCSCIGSSLVGKPKFSNNPAGLLEWWLFKQEAQGPGAQLM
jgi:hypothetical protein